MVNNINSEPEERLNYHGLSKFLDNLKTLFAFKTDMPAKLSQLENDVGYKTSDTVYTHPSYTAKSSGLYKVSVDSTGHINSTTEVTKADITQLGILSETPSFNDTTSTYSTLSAANTAAETSSNAIKSGVNILTTLSNIKKTFAAIIQGLKILGTNVGMIQGITSDLNAESDYVAASAKALSTINSNLGRISDSLNALDSAGYNHLALLNGCAGTVSYIKIKGVYILTGFVYAANVWIANLPEGPSNVYPDQAAKILAINEAGEVSLGNINNVAGITVPSVGNYYIHGIIHTG